MKMELKRTCDVTLSFLGLDRILLADPFFNLFPLRSQHDTLPFYDPSALTVLSHNVQTLIEDLNYAPTL